MTAPETPDELRARFDRLPAEMERLLEERAEREYSTSYETSGFYVFNRSDLDDFIEYAIALVDWGTIDALLAENVQLRQAADLFRANFSPWLIHNAPDLYRSLWGEW